MKLGACLDEEPVSSGFLSYPRRALFLYAFHKLKHVQGSLHFSSTQLPNSHDIYRAHLRDNQYPVHHI